MSAVAEEGLCSDIRKRQKSAALAWSFLIIVAILLDRDPPFEVRDVWRFMVDVRSCVMSVRVFRSSESGV